MRRTACFDINGPTERQLMLWFFRSTKRVALTHWGEFVRWRRQYLRTHADRVWKVNQGRVIERADP